jgi:Protein of unknown function (DUF1822)
MYFDLAPLNFNVLLGSEAHQRAENIREHYSDTSEANQVYRYALARSAGEMYLKTNGLNVKETDFSTWNFKTQPITDIACVDIEGIGRVQFVPATPVMNNVEVPDEVRSHKVAYVIVQLDEEPEPLEELSEAILVGFSDKVKAEELSLEGLRAIDELSEYLHLCSINDQESASSTQRTKDPEANRQNYLDLESKINFVNQLMLAKTGKSLDKVQEHILQQTLEGKRLGDIEIAGYGSGVVQQIYAPKLWQLLTEATGKRVTRGTVQSVLENALNKQAHNFPKRLESSHALGSLEETSRQSQQTPVHLARWLQGEFDDLWQAVKNAIDQPLHGIQMGKYIAAGHSTEQSVEREKTIELENQENVKLIVSLMPKDSQKVDVVIEIVPSKRDMALPPNLELSLLSETGEELLTYQSGDGDCSLQLDQVEWTFGDHFSIRVRLHNFEFTEHFTV